MFVPFPFCCEFHFICLFPTTLYALCVSSFSCCPFFDRSAPLLCSFCCGFCLALSPCVFSIFTVSLFLSCVCHCFLGYLLSPFENLLSFLLNILSRHFEYQADLFAVQYGFGSSLSAALLSLQSDNLASWIVDTWFSTYHFNHPHMLERLQTIEHENRKVQEQLIQESNGVTKKELMAQIIARECPTPPPASASSSSSSCSSFDSGSPTQTSSAVSASQDSGESSSSTTAAVDTKKER